MPFRNPAGRAGLLNNVVGLAHSLAVYFESRFALFAAESKRALVHLLILVGCLIAAAMLTAFGYVFLLVTAIFGLARLLEVSWIWIALGSALVHFTLAVICVLVARQRVRHPLFQSTALELKKDREWLQNLDRPETSPR